MPVLTVFIVLLCGRPLLLVNFHRFPFEVQESFYFKNAVNCLEKLELVICMHSLRLCSRWQLNLFFVPWEIRRYIFCVPFFLIPGVRGVVFEFPPNFFFFLEKNSKWATKTPPRYQVKPILHWYCFRKLWEELEVYWSLSNLFVIAGGTWNLLRQLHYDMLISHWWRGRKEQIATEREEMPLFKFVQLSCHMSDCHSGTPRSLLGGMRPQI